jgi:hypothetical protein
MRVVVSQPMYFPWAGFMAQMAMADVYIWLDDAQYSKGSYTNRIQVKMPNGCKWMTVPLDGKGAFQRIIDLRAVDTDWIASHRALLAQSLRTQPHILESLGLFDGVMAGDGTLCDRLIAGAEAQAAHLGVLPARILRASRMAVPGTSGDRVLALVKAVEGTEYITGHGALAYLDHQAFNASGISVSYMDYAPLQWAQPHGGFTPFVTSLDLIAAHDAKTARAHLRPASLDWRTFKARKEQTI